MSAHPAPAELLEDRDRLRELVDLLWGELDLPTVLELQRHQPEVVEACKLNHELVGHGEDR